MGTLKTGTTIGGSTAWHAGNDGPATGLDADTVDGVNSTGLYAAQVAASAPVVKGVGDLWTGGGSIVNFDQGWVYPTLIGGWTDYGGGYPPARYRKAPDGIVFMDGLIKGGVTGSVPFILPAKYCPEYRLLLTTINNDQVIARIDIAADGQVICYFNAGTNGWYSLKVNFWAG